jgi:hypothetical protein
MAKKQTFADKVDKIKSAGAQHCPVCDEIPIATKVRTFVNEGGRMKLVTKPVKVCKCNSSTIYG